MAATFSSGTLKVYFDGSLISTTSGTAPTPSGSVQLWFGDQPDFHGQFYTGDLDQVRISDNVRYTTTFVPSRTWAVDANTVAYWKFGEGSGTTAADATGHGHTGTLAGATLPTWVAGA